jgi:hypothetical protein
MKKVSKPIYWTPRILSILFVLFLALFSLDTFDSCSSVLSCFVGLLIHNIPVFILIIILVIAWKHEIVGAIAFILAGLAYIILIITSQKFQWFMLSWSLIIAGPAFLVGTLFYIGWKRKHSRHI